MKTATFEDFPWRMIAISNAINLGIYAIGFSMMSHLGIVWGLLYVAYGVWLEWRLLSRSCRYCYYYGRRCAFGKGAVCSWFFSKGSAETFCAKQISWRDIVPDFMVSLVPAAAGIIMLIRNFSWAILLAVAFLLLLGTAGTGMVRGRIACKYCKQREIGCPAEQLFSKRAHA